MGNGPCRRFGAENFREPLAWEGGRIHFENADWMEGALDQSIKAVLRQHFAFYAAYPPVQGLEGGDNSKWKLCIVVIWENTERGLIRE